MIDTLRADALSPYGAKRQASPQIAAFAERSVVFERAGAQSSWTRASVASILSSRYPGAHGAEGRDDRLSENVTLLSEVVAEHGYRTGFITTNPNTGRFFGFDQGFDDLIELYNHDPKRSMQPSAMKASAEEVAREVTRWIESGPQPFLLVVLSIDPHSPYTPPLRFDHDAARATSGVDGTKQWINRRDLSAADKARIRSLYAGEVAYADHGFGQVLETLERLGIHQRTVTVLTSDHGEEFWEHGNRGHGETLYQETLHVPLIIHAPWGLGNPRREPGDVETIDIFPTLLELAGLPIPEGISGRSLVERRRAARQRAIASLKIEEHDALSVREGNWKLIWNRTDDHQALYDMRIPGEQQPMQQDAAARTAALMQILEKHLHDVTRERLALLGRATRDGVAIEDLPENERRLLIELGYFEREARINPEPSH